MERRVVVTGMGWVTPLGDDIEDVWRNLLSGKSGMAATTLFNAETFPSAFSAEVKSFSLADYLGDQSEAHKNASRNTGFALAAATRAWKSSGLSSHLGLNPARVGVYLGGGEGPLDFEPFATAALAGCRNANGEITPLDTVWWPQAAMNLLNAKHEL